MVNMPVLTLLSDAWKTWFPEMKLHYEENEKALEALLKEKGLEGLKSAFEGFVQAAYTCNLGPQTVTPMHRDAQNLSYGLCMVSAFARI